MKNRLVLFFVLIAAPLVGTTPALSVTYVESFINICFASGGFGAPCDGVYVRTITDNFLTPTSDGTLTLEARGHFGLLGGVDGDVAVAVEGIELGIFLNNNPDDDLFDNASFGDVGVAYGSPVTASAVLTLAQLEDIISDGIIEITYTLIGMHDIFGNTYINASITYDGLAAVPLPAALPLFVTAIGGIGLFGWRRRRRAAHS
jgi:hypothetical protein